MVQHGAQLHDTVSAHKQVGTEWVNNLLTQHPLDLVVLLDVVGGLGPEQQIVKHTASGGKRMALEYTEVKKLILLKPLFQ